MDDRSKTPMDVPPTPAETANAADVRAHEGHDRPDVDGPDGDNSPAQPPPAATEPPPDPVTGDLGAATVGTEPPPEPPPAQPPVPPSPSASNGDGTVGADDHAATTSTATPAAEVELECPECGLVLVGHSPRPSAEWFCPRCDFPVFWASPPAPSATPQHRARRRLPGTGGTEVLGAEPCWRCGELNDPDANVCVRCSAAIPRPAEPEPVEVRVPVPTPVPAPYVVRSSSGPFVAAGVLAGAAVATLVTAWVVNASGATNAAGTALSWLGW